jgi:YbbR domain-containing protein
MSNLFTKNLWLKLASLVIAITLWFFVILSGRADITMDIPISYINLPPKLDVMDYPDTVSITIEGQERLLKNFKKDEVHAVIDLSEARTGKSFFNITKDNVELPKAFTVTNINPETISLTIEDLLIKSVSVTPKIVGLPKKGFAILEVRVVPETITLEGPKSLILKIRNVKTEPIDISGINSNLSYRANLNLSNSNIRKNTNKVDVIISVREIK